MAKVKVGINGFGRIGRQALKNILRVARRQLDVVAINDLLDTKTNAHLFKYDSNYGTYQGTVEARENSIVIDGQEIAITAERDPANIPWKKCGRRRRRRVDRLLHRRQEGDGAHRRRRQEGHHLRAGPQRGHHRRAGRQRGASTTRSKHHVISNASCTTNGLAPVAKVLYDNYGIEKGFLTTVHAYTNSQRLLDVATKDLRDARAAALNIVPAATGAARAVGLVIPELQGKFGGMAFRVPIADRLGDRLHGGAGEEDQRRRINAAMQEASQGPLKGILQYTEEPLVSTDLKGNTHSSIFSAMDTHDDRRRLLQGRLLVRQRVGLRLPPRRHHGVRRGAPGG